MKVAFTNNCGLATCAKDSRLILNGQARKVSIDTTRYARQMLEIKFSKQRRSARMMFRI